jgi:MFS transporter, DHA1 family, inner membrane transport protein
MGVLTTPPAGSSDQMGAASGCADPRIAQLEGAITTRNVPHSNPSTIALATAQGADTIDSPPSDDSLRRPLAEWLLLLMLAAVQFTVAVDFVIMMPLGPQLMRIFAIDTPAFNFAVAAYSGAAGLSAVVAAFFLDRFDRKTVLLWIYAGFAIGTLLCAVAPNYLALVFARGLAGCFGGIVGGIALAMVGDLVPDARRASAVGTVMSAFSVAQVAGVPLGLYLADALGWHVPFLWLATVSGIIWIFALIRLPKVRAHLAMSRSETPVRRFIGILDNSNHLRALALTAVITLGGFMIFPDLANYLVANVRLSSGELRWVYLIGGGATLFTMNGVGQLADRFGRMRVFSIMMVCSIFVAFLTTNLPVVPATVAVAVSTIFMISMTGRFVPAMAMITSSVEPEHRGGFMSVNSAVAHICAALAATAAGWVIRDGPEHRLVGFGLVGWIYLGWAIIGLWLASRLRNAGVAQSRRG